VTKPPRFDREYYDRSYRDYERQNPPHKLRFYRGLAERYAPRTGRPRLLDVGCAFGAFLSVLDPGWERYGSDVSEFAIAEARKSVPGVVFDVASATDLPFDGTFDVITAFDVIEHVPSLDEIAVAVRSRLSPEGHFIYVVPVYDGPTGPIVALLDKDPTHLHKRSREFWLEWTAAHFDLVDWCGILRYLLPWGPYLHRPTRSLRRYTPAVAVVARR
jgi:SAM-dependent methyltransferase